VEIAVVMMHIRSVIAVFASVNIQFAENFAVPKDVMTQEQNVSIVPIAQTEFVVVIQQKGKKCIRKKPFRPVPSVV